jgi:glycerol-3-phosphate dehydrogenase (NAD(P)+)
MGEALEGADLVVVAVPSRHLRSVARLARERIPSQALVLSLSKGLETETGKRMTEVLAEVLAPHEPSSIGVLSGPNLAEELITGQPSATCVAFPHIGNAQAVQRLLMSDRLRVYTSSDVIGCEIGGAVKNVIAIAAGIADGLGYAMNTKAALLTRGLAELSRLGAAAGGDPLTFLGLSGIGDLIATCGSPRSRNHRVGEQLAAGRTVNDIVSDSRSVAEGVETAPAVVALAHRLGVDMPICETVVAICSGRLTPSQALPSLMQRTPKRELEGLDASAAPASDGTAGPDQTSGR